MFYKVMYHLFEEVNDMVKKLSLYKRYFKRYNIVPLVILALLLFSGTSTIFMVESWDNKILFFIAFLALAYPIISNVEKTEEKLADKKIQLISCKSAYALKTELNKALQECKKNKYRNVDVHIVDTKNAFLIITE